MSVQHTPSSDFLAVVLNGEAPLCGNRLADANLQKVIELATDKDRSNRDWASFILGNFDCESPEIRAALLRAAEDRDARVRAEAIRGLARKYPDIALPLIERALAHPPVMANIFEAAALIAHNSLIAPLIRFAEKSLNDGLDELIADALNACQSGLPDERYR